MTFTSDDLRAAQERLIKMPPRPWTNPWLDLDDAEAIRDAEGEVVIGVVYYDGPHLEIDVEVCQFILATINTNYPLALDALEEAWEKLRRIQDMCDFIIKEHQPLDMIRRRFEQVQKILRPTEEGQ